MSVSNVTSSTGVGQPSWRATVHQAREDFEQLFRAMQAGNLTNAQQAYTDLQQLQTSNPVNSTTASSTAANTNSGTTATKVTGPIASDWSALGQALQSGSATSAQSAFSQLQQDLQAYAQPLAVYAAMSNLAPATSTAVSGTGTPADPVSSDLKALNQALQSGNTTSAQDLLAQLEKDLQASGQGSIHHHHHHHGGFGHQNPAAAYSSAAGTGTASSGAVSPGSSGSAVAVAGSGSSGSASV